MCACAAHLHTQTALTINLYTNLTTTAMAIEVIFTTRALHNLFETNCPLLRSHSSVSSDHRDRFRLCIKPSMVNARIRMTRSESRTPILYCTRSPQPRMFRPFKSKASRGKACVRHEMSAPSVFVLLDGRTWKVICGWTEVIFEYGLLRT